MKTISSFRALDVSRRSIKVFDDDQDRLVGSWWRQNGNLAVGGVADVVNVWNCPEERCVRVSLCLV